MKEFIYGHIYILKFIQLTQSTLLFTITHGYRSTEHLKELEVELILKVFRYFQVSHLFIVAVTVIIPAFYL
jgi:hypothetical protein